VDPMQNAMGVACARMLALAILVFATRVSAAEYPLSGEFLHLRSQVTPGMAGIRLGATGDALPEGDVSADPRVTGAVLEVLGDGVLGAGEPAVPLPWRDLARTRRSTWQPRLSLLRLVGSFRGAESLAALRDSRVAEHPRRRTRMALSNVGDAPCRDGAPSYRR